MLDDVFLKFRTRHGSIASVLDENYQLQLSREAEASELVIFPQSMSESHGIEDLRMVRFVEDDDMITRFAIVSLDSLLNRLIG
ncbi:MAG: hypothetical protein ACLP9L_33535 [Thermoguttaceae bacterium]